MAQWLRRCATNRKVAGSIPDGVIGIFHRHNPSDRTEALGSTQRLTEWVPGGFPGGKCGRCVRLTTLPSSCAVAMKSGNLNFLKPSGPLQACNGTDFDFIYRNCHNVLSSKLRWVNQAHSIICIVAVWIVTLCRLADNCHHFKQAACLCLYCEYSVS